MKLKAILTTAVVAMVVCFLGAAAAGAAAAPFVYVANSGSDNVSQYDSFGGGLSPLSPFTVPAGSRPFRLAVSPDGRSVYATNPGDGAVPGTVSQYTVGPGGVLAPKTPATVAAGSFPIGVAVSPDSRSVYVTNQVIGLFDGSVLQYSAGADGALTPKSPPTVATGANPEGIAVSVDGRSVYVANNGIARVEGSLGQHSVGPGGALIPKSPPEVGVGRNPSELALSPDGRNVYATSITLSTLSQYSVGEGGVLTFQMAVNTGAGPFGLAITPDGKSIYVANEFVSAVSQYSVGAGGALSVKSPATVPTGVSPIAVAVAPDGQSAYVTSGNDNAVYQYDIDPESGVLAPKSPASVAAGTLPSGIAVTPLPRMPTSNEQCKNGGWRNFPQFKNQGQCIAFVNHGP
jgi:DNA-binding beta-propeller fold protein YncE